MAAWPAATMVSGYRDRPHAGQMRYHVSSLRRIFISSRCDMNFVGGNLASPICRSFHVFCVNSLPALSLSLSGVFLVLLGHVLCLS